MYEWRSDVNDVYKATIQRINRLYESSPRKWISEDLEKGSLVETVDGGGKVNVAIETPDSMAGQFYTYMPGHSFKVEYLLDHLKANHALPLHTSRACLAIVDIGCGGATASTALINTLLRKPVSDTRILFVGVDNNHCAIQLYDWMMDGYRRIPELADRIEYHALPKGIPEAFTYVAEGIHRAKTRWGIPSLSDLWVVQANVVRPLREIWEKDIASRNLLELDAVRGLIPDDFGDVEAQAYEQLLRLSEADRMLIMTVATKDKFDSWRKYSSALGDALMRVFMNKGHKPSRVHNSLDDGQPCSVAYRNPVGSYWRAQGSQNYTGQFYADVEFVESQQFLADLGWQEIISEDNLKLAWARVRAAMVRESLVDEIGLRLFEAQLDVNLKTIQDRLLTYTIRLADFPRVFYEVPKDESKTRPRALQAIHEEVLAVAVVQVLGKRVQELMSRNYGYRLELSGKTEYLYRPWFRSYGRFKDAIRRVLNRGDENGVVLRTDIENFYPSILQENLLNVVLDRFHLTEKSRAAWLVRQLLLRNNSSHDSGVLQGPLASGFWANLYLLELDNRFSDDYSSALLYRYVDDIVLVIPDKSRQDLVQQDLLGHVQALELKLSEEKTVIETFEAALEGMQKEKILDELDKKVRQLTDGLYFTHPDYHQILDELNEHDWWEFVRYYQQCLYELGIFVEATRLSRKLWQYIRTPLLKKDRRLRIPDFSLVNESSSWTAEFSSKNEDWTHQYDEVKQELSDILKEKWTTWKEQKETNPDNLDEKELKARLKKIQTYLSFTLNRLTRFGYGDVLSQIEEIFCTYPHILKTHRMILDHLALQGYGDTLRNIWQCLQTSTVAGAPYLRALILRAWRSTSLMINPGVMLTLENVSMTSGLKDDNGLIEALMATETLIFTTTYIPSESKRKNFLHRAFEIRWDCPQLARNLLILAQRRHVQPEQHELLRELLDEWFFIEMKPSSYGEPDFSELTLEPQELRQNYYYSRYPDNAEEFEGDYF